MLVDFKLQVHRYFDSMVEKCCHRVNEKYTFIDAWLSSLLLLTSSFLLEYSLIPEVV